MREILFRGKTYDGEWEIGCLHYEYGEADRNGKRTVDYRILGMRGECRYVIPETVGQFTGLTDKNGERIFEGDILLYQINIKTAIVGKISFICGAFVFESEELDRECDIAFSTFADDEIALSQHCIEVIGNIHDTPELLEVLKSAGVVDSGGAGIVWVFEGMQKYLNGEQLPESAPKCSQKTADYSKFDRNSTFEFGYCTEFLLQLTNGKEPFCQEEFLAELKKLGNSLVTVSSTFFFCFESSGEWSSATANIILGRTLQST